MATDHITVSEAPMNLVHLRLRRGEAIAEARLVDTAGILYFCAKDWCPHYQGQLSLVAGAETMICALVQHPPDRTCQAFYLEVAEDLDRHRRQTWEQRLAEAEAFETAVATAAAGAGSPSPAWGECVWERGPGGEDPGEAGLSSSPSPGGRVGDGRGGQGVRSGEGRPPPTQ